MASRLGAKRPQRLCAACKTRMPEPAASSPVVPSPSLGGVLSNSSGSTGPAAQATPAAGGAAAAAKSKVDGLQHAVTAAKSIAESVVAPDNATMQLAHDVAAMVPVSGAVVDIAGQVFAGLLAVADRFPLASQCGGLLRDLFGMYQVS